MPRRSVPLPVVECHPVTSERWCDFETLFGPRGACGGCWCMLWRCSRADFDRNKGDGNRDAMRNLIESGTQPGILAYRDGQAVGWCAVAPREDYPGLARSRILRPVDDTPVWSVSCLFVDKDHRGQGISVALLQGALEFVGQRGGSVVEGYPVEPKNDQMPPAFAWTGLASAFLKAGFTEVARGSETRPIVRANVAPPPKPKPKARRKGK